MSALIGFNGLEQSLAAPLPLWPHAQEQISSPALGRQTLPGVHYRGSCLQACHLDWPHPYTVGSCPVDGSLRCTLYLASEAVSVPYLGGPNGILWMYSGADGLIAMLGANDGHCNQPAALPTVLRPCRTAPHRDSTTCFRVTMAPCQCYLRKQPADASHFIWELDF